MSLKIIKSYTLFYLDDRWEKKIWRRCSSANISDAITSILTVYEFILGFTFHCRILWNPYKIYYLMCNIYLEFFDKIEQKQRPWYIIISGILISPTYFNIAHFRETLKEIRFNWQHLSCSPIFEESKVDRNKLKRTRKIIHGWLRVW